MTRLELLKKHPLPRGCSEVGPNLLGKIIPSYNRLQREVWESDRDRNFKYDHKKEKDLRQDLENLALRPGIFEKDPVLLPILEGSLIDIHREFSRNDLLIQAALEFSKGELPAVAHKWLSVKMNGSDSLYRAGRFSFNLHGIKYDGALRKASGEFVGVALNMNHAIYGCGLWADIALMEYEKRDSLIEAFNILTDLRSNPNDMTELFNQQEVDNAVLWVNFLI